jgi:hypothetical protein
MQDVMFTWQVADARVGEGGVGDGVRHDRRLDLAQLQPLLDATTGATGLTLTIEPWTFTRWEAVHDPLQQLPSFYFVGGTVKRPGAYDVADREITLKQAVVAAGLPEGDVHVTLIRREPATGPAGEQFFEYELSDILAGRVADPVIRATDVINVKSSTDDRAVPAQGVDR